jgi:ribosomal protein L21
MTQLNKYKVKEGRAIEHENVRYEGGQEIELDAELALHHAANIELVKEEKPSKFTKDKTNDVA